MKKLILILMVGSLFGDTIVYKIGDNNRSIKNVEFTRAENGKVYFIVFGQETSRDCNRIIEFNDDDGNPIDYDCTVILNEPKKEKPLLNINNKSNSHNHFKEFQKDYDRGFFIFRLGQFIFTYSVFSFKQNTMLAGGGISLIGGLIMVISFNEVNQDGGELIGVGKNLILNN